VKSEKILNAFASENFGLRRQGSNLRPSGYRFAPFAVPEKIIGLTRILDFFDRCTRLLLAASATGSARKRAPTSHARRSHNLKAQMQTIPKTKKDTRLGVLFDLCCTANLDATAEKSIKSRIFDLLGQIHVHP